MPTSFLIALSRFSGRVAYRLYLGVGVSVLAATVLFTIFPQFPAGFHTLLFVAQALNAPVKPQSWFTATPTRTQVVYPRPDGPGEADIYYIPDGKRRAALLVFLGANAAGPDDPDVVNVGNALARAGYVAMFVWSPAMGQQNNVAPAEIENLIHAFQYLRRREFVDPARTGMAGFSVGASFVMVAAADSRIRQDVAFVNSFGAYYDARELLVQVASNSRIFNGQTEPWPVDQLTRRVFANELIKVAPEPEEQAWLARRFLYDTAAAGEMPPLSPPADLSRQLLEGPTPEQAEALLEQLPPDFQAKLHDISPSRRLADLPGRLMIMHDIGDPLIPVGESRKLVAALREQGRSDLRYTETEIFEHVRPGSDLQPWKLLKGGFQLYRHMYGIFRMAA